MKRQLKFAYLHAGNAYINLTNKCCNDCEFCLRRNGDGIHEDTLWLSREPLDAGEVIAQLKSLNGDFSEVIFCGFGESTYKMEEMIAVADYAHQNGYKTRLNTNGLGDLINKRDIVGELKGKIDTVSVSLNSYSAKTYDDICHSVYGLNAFDALINFSTQCVKAGIDTRLTVVDCIGREEIEKCQKLADSVGVVLRVRKEIKDNKSYT